MTEPVTDPRWSLAGAAVVAAALAAALTARTEAALMVAGAGLVGWVARQVQQARAWPLALAVPAGWLVARAALDDAHAGWPGIAAVAALVSVAGGCGRMAATGWSPRVPLLAMAVTCGGVYVCVPETDAARRFGVVLAVGVLAAAVAAVAVPVELLAAATTLVVFVALAGGQYRASAVIGSLGSLGLLAVAWAVPPRPPDRRRDVAALVVHGTGVLLASRVAGLGAGVARPALIVVATWVVAVGAVVAMDRRWNE